MAGIGERKMSEIVTEDQNVLVRNRCYMHENDDIK